jgi:saccharopine dehydrogenase-like NADP-dependent oxidoreductase
LTSVCGGLPAPKNANNPIKYKFSWSPEGVLRAAQRPAQYLEDGNVVSVEGPNMLSHRQTVDFFPGFDIEQIPNGYSLPYLEYYRIPEARSIFRGTLRYTGFCHIMQECLKLGLLSESIQVKRNQKWKDIIRELPLFSLTDDLTRQFLDWLGIFSNENAKVKKEGQSLMRAFCDLLLEKLSFLPNEQDLVLMYIGIEARYPDGEVKIHEARFEALGKPNGDTIMSKTVGITAAIGVKLILESQIKSTGIVRPTSIEVYDPCLKLLESEGIIFQERILNRMK